MIKAVLFDFDGTIADSSEGIMECALKTVAEIGYDTSIYTKDYLRRFIGPPLSDCFRITFSVPEPMVEWCVERYRHFYHFDGMFKMRAYPGIVELLEELRRRGIKTAVATNKIKDLAEKCCTNLGLEPLFDYISGPGKDGGITKARVIELAIEALGVDKEDVLMVGDTINDEKGAEGAGVAFLPVTWGFGFDKNNTENGRRADVPSDVLNILEEKKRMIERINSENAPKAVGPYSQAVKANGFLFVSGMLALDPQTGEMVGESAADQAKQIFKNIKAVLDEAGTKMENIVKAIVYLEDIADFGAVNTVYAEAFKDAPVLPARCAFQVVKLPKNGKVEIEVTVAL